MRSLWTRESIIRHLLEREAKGLPLTVGGPGIDKSMYSAARRIFGSWRNAIQAVGITPHDVLTWERWSPPKILVMIRHFARRNRPLTTKQMDQRYHNVVTAARRHFGSWNKAVLAAGVDPRKLQRVIPWTSERVIEAILTRALRNESLVPSRVEPRSLLEAGHRFFGSWHDAIAAAGLDPVLASRKETRTVGAPDDKGHSGIPKPSERPKLHWNNDRVIAAIRLRLLERKPVHCAALAQDDKRLYNAMRRYFGGWKKAMRAVGLDPAAHRMLPPGRKRNPAQRSIATKSTCVELSRPEQPC
ncbi:MAG: helix-turn-helix domain protein [Phycisphaerales bacterium]|nr:helix-turn-helix domain protein [Phycisphaerales bacterium]